MRCHLRQLLLLGVLLCLGLVVLLQIIQLKEQEQSDVNRLVQELDVPVKQQPAARAPVTAVSQQIASHPKHNISRHQNLHAGEAHAKVWVDPNSVEDRIVEQLFSPYSLPVLTTKTLLIYNGGRETTGDKVFRDNQCGVQQCVISTNNKDLAIADAVLFRGSSFPSVKMKPRSQVWVWSTLESPFHSRGLAGMAGAFNWTATYRRDSTIVSPYERFVPFDNFTGLPEAPKRNYAQGKTKMVAWFVSNCNAGNGRLQYVKELAKHIPVHIYGPCGEYSCPRRQAAKCFDMLNKDYKFYLAFENSNCRDYITEKFYWNGLWSVHGIP
jgi:glycoprotein 3-alpha-L-fucosyltransferase